MANMTPQEQLMLELTNRARMDPAGEAKRFGITLNEGLRDGTISSAPKQVLAGNDSLAKAADKHSSWMLETDTFSHYARVGTTGYTGYAPQDRMKSAGYSFTGSWTSGENIAFTGTTQRVTSAMQTQFIIDQHRGLFVDEGVVGRGHRINILNNGFEEVGIGQKIGAFVSGGTSYNSGMVTQDFATSGTKIFVTGVIYNDTVIADDFFSVGEQAAGVAVTSSGAVADKTGAGGGYELLYARSGAKTVDFALSSGKVSVGLTLGDSNVKVDVVNGNEVWSNVSITSVSTNVKEVHLLGISKADLNGASNGQKMFGNKAANVLKGNGGNDTLIGGGGADRLDGGAGTDTASYDGATKGVTASLAKPADNTNDAKGDTYISIENLTGSSKADTLIGDAADNVIKGGSGDDVIQGGGGADDLYGGSGKDTFVYKALADSTAASRGRDTIFDFSGTGGDKIDLAAIDAIARTTKNDGFSFIGTAAFSGKAGELRYDKKASETYIYGDVNGDKTADFAIHLDDAVTLTKGYFVL